MKKILLATTAVLGLAAAPGIAHATLNYTILQNVNASGTPAALQANLAGFNAATPLAGITFNTTSPVDNLVMNSGANNTLGAFFANQLPLTPPFGLGQTNDVMSNVGNTDTTFIRITETYIGQSGATFTLTHDDGATIVVDGTQICGTPGPTSSVTENCVLPAGTATQTHNLTLYYEESFGQPAILTVRLPTEAVPAPEPASLALLGSALIGFGVWRRRRRAG